MGTIAAPNTRYDSAVFEANTIGTYGPVTTLFPPSSYKYSQEVGKHPVSGLTPAQPPLLTSNPQNDIFFGTTYDSSIFEVFVSHVITAGDISRSGSLHLGGVYKVANLQPDDFQSQYILSWSNNADVLLQSASTVTGPWANVVGATASPYTNPISGTAQFFRLTPNAFNLPPIAPTVTTLPAIGIQPAYATLSGQVVPNGGDSTAWFQWGTTTNYGSLTPTSFVSASNSLVIASLVSGLSPGVTYHYELVARNSVGIVAGGDSSFTTTLPCVTLPMGLAYWWPANGNAIDIIGANNGTLQGGVTFTNGEAGQAFNFDGATGFVSTSLLITNPQNFSLSLWFKTATTNGGVLISFDSSQTSVADGSQFDRNLYLDDTGALHFGVWNAGPQQINSAAGYNDDNWHWVVGSLSASTGLSLYVDGVLAGNNAAVTSASANYNGYWRFGEDNLNNWPYPPTSDYFQGQIDEVAIFNTALNSNNVAAIYAAGSAGMCPP
jgi:hypothetical protein